MAQESYTGVVEARAEAGADLCQRHQHGCVHTRKRSTHYATGDVRVHAVLSLFFTSHSTIIPYTQKDAEYHEHDREKRER